MQDRTETPKWQFILLFIGSLIGLLGFLSLAALMAFSSLINLLLPGANIDPGMLPTSFLMACALTLCGLAIVPAGIHNYQRMNGKAVPAARLRPLKIWQGIVILAAWTGAVAASQWLFQSFKLGWLFAAPFYLAAIGLPILLLVWLGLGGLPIGSRNRFWSTLGVGLTASPIAASILELLVYLVILLGGIIVIASNPDWSGTITRISEQITSTTDLNAILQMLTPYIFNPIVLVIVFLVLAVATPIIEEAIKPILIWFTAGRIQNPATGFALGALSGAGFALIEGLLAGSTPDSGWAFLLVARAGGSLMHIVASGLMGWAIVSAWHGKHARLVWTYLLCIVIHGTWNSAAVLIELGSLQASLSGTGNATTNSLSVIGITILGAMVVIIFSLLLLVNHKLRPSNPKVAAGPEMPVIRP